MYWRVRKVGVDQIVRMYGLHAVLVVSVLANLFLVATRPDPKKTVSAEQKTSFDTFSRTVTQHILDTSYISYSASTKALIGTNSEPGELSKSVIDGMKKQELLAKTWDELKATQKTLEDQRQVSAVRIDEVTQGELENVALGNAQVPLVPVVVKGVVAVHSAEEQGPSGPVPFRFKYWLGTVNNTTKPIVVQFQDLSQRPG